MSLRVKPYRFSSEQQDLLDELFGEREAWLPMPLDDLIAALVEAQAHDLAASEQATLAFTSTLGSTKVRVVPSVVRIGNATRPEEVTMAASAITVQPLADAIAKQWPEATLVEKKAYHRIALDKLTLGYAYVTGTRPAVEVPKGDGKYLYVSVKTKADLTKTINAMKAVEKRAAKKAKA
jgi:hypothetical protein